MHQLLILMCIVVVTKYVDAGVITSASEIRNNNIDTTKYPESNVSFEELALKKSNKPTKYWTSKNIPLFKKIPKGFVKYSNKLFKYPDTFYQELYGISKIEEKVKKRMHDLIKTTIKVDLNKASPLPTNFVSVEEQVNNEFENMNNVKEVVEITSQDDNASTEDILLNVDQETIEDDNQRVLKEFIQSHTVIPTKSDCHSESSEEKKDLDEFIFILEPQVVWEDVVDDEDIEINTQVLVPKPRSKRSVNMIEEENLGTTVSGFKFTGRDMRLSNDLHYKNINS